MEPTDTAHLDGTEAHRAEPVAGLWSSEEQSMVKWDMAADRGLMVAEGHARSSPLRNGWIQMSRMKGYQGCFGAFAPSVADDVSGFPK
jgi:hypothetical protein